MGGGFWGIGRDVEGGGIVEWPDKHRGSLKNFTNSVKFRNLVYGHRRISDRPEANCLLSIFPGEFRLEIHPLCVSRENMGKAKKYEGIAGCLFAFVGEIALERYFEQA